MGSQGGWTNELITSLTLPSGAGPNDPRVVIGGDLPANLVAYYNVRGETAIAGTVYYRDAADYEYDILVTAGALIVLRAVGGTTLGVVGELYRCRSQLAVSEFIFGQYENFSFQLGVTGSTSPQFVVEGTSNIQIQDAAALQFISSGTFALNLVANGGDLTIDSRSAPRGYVDGVNVGASTLAAGVSAETNLSQLQLTANVISGREYLITMQCRASVTVTTDDWDIRLRRDTAVTGTQLGLGQFSGFDLIGVPTFSWLFPSAATETLNLFLSVARNAGTGTITIIGAPGGSTARTFATIQDIGATSDFRAA